tara:strand:- start:637 stop:1011 length:375 start_codon:yes stop_codon:yes gene_type:complete
MVVMTVITAVRAVAHVVANRSAQYCTGNRQQCAAITTAKLVADESADNTTDYRAGIGTTAAMVAVPVMCITFLHGHRLIPALFNRRRNLHGAKQRLYADHFGHIPIRLCGGAHRCGGCQSNCGC